MVTNWRPHFSLKALLIIMALVAVCIGAYVIGYERGYDAGIAEPWSHGL